MVPCVSVEEERGPLEEATWEVLRHVVGDAVVVAVGVHDIIGREVDAPCVPSFEVVDGFIGQSFCYDVSGYSLAIYLQHSVRFGVYNG